jgi:hypothetical protein
MKDSVNVPDGFAKILNKCIMPQYDSTNNYGIKNMSPSRNSSKQGFKTRCNLDTNIWNPYTALNGCNVHKRPCHALPPP